MDEVKKLLIVQKHRCRSASIKIGIMQKGTKSFTENQISAVSFRWNGWACRDLLNLASLIWKLHKHQNSIIRTIDLWSAFLAKRIQREVGTKAPFLGKEKKVKYTPKVKFIFWLSQVSQVTSISNLSVSFLFRNNWTTQ